MGNRHEGIATGVGVATATARIVKNLVMTSEADELLANLAQETGMSEGDMLRVALGMFKAAVDAKRQGMHVGVAATPEALDVEFVGF
jgi:hypothetical protein